MRRTLLALGAVAAVLAGAGCETRAPDRSPVAAAPTLSSRVRTGGIVPRATPADFRGPTAVYRRHVRAALASMLGEVGRLRTAIAAGDRAAARRAWLAADEAYESIGAAYGAFGTRDARINGDGAGLHRVERVLWSGGSLAAAAGPATRLRADVTALRAHVGRMTIDPLAYALRAHEVLEDTLHLQLSGRLSPYSGAALVALRGNLRGTRVVLDSLRAMLKRRNPGVVVQADRALADLRRALADQQRRGGTLPRWDALSQPRRERVAGLTAAAAERLAFVPELIDPRPPRALQSAFGRQEQ
jgi:iron uptake system EfeUOB component EfeO/EfeM